MDLHDGGMIHGHGCQADEAWISAFKANSISGVRQILTTSGENVGWLTDTRTLRCAWLRVASNRGARMPGSTDDVGHIRANKGEQRF